MPNPASQKPSILSPTDILSVKDAAAGFSNTGVLTVMALYAVAQGVSQTGALDVLMGRVLGRARSVHWALVRMMVPVMVVSAAGGRARRGKDKGEAGAAGGEPGGACSAHPPTPPLPQRRPPPPLPASTPPPQSSAFLNNTPIVALLIPILLSWARRCAARWGAAYILLFQWLLPGHDGDGHIDLVSELLVVDRCEPSGFIVRDPSNQVGP